jgi:hypothetical protein
VNVKIDDVGALGVLGGVTGANVGFLGTTVVGGTGTEVVGTGVHQVGGGGGVCLVTGTYGGNQIGTVSVVGTKTFGTREQCFEGVGTCVVGVWIGTCVVGVWIGTCVVGVWIGTCVVGVWIGTCVVGVWIGTCVVGVWIGTCVVGVWIGKILVGIEGVGGNNVVGTDVGGGIVVIDVWWITGSVFVVVNGIGPGITV